MIKKLFALCLVSFGLVLATTPVNSITPIIGKQNALTGARLDDCVIVDIAAGTDHNIVLDRDGNLWTWGKNDHGQLGNGTTVNSNTPEQIFKGHKFKKISAGDSVSAAIDLDDKIYVWGLNTNNEDTEYHVPTLFSDATYKDVKCGASNVYTISLTDTGRLYNPIYQSFIYNWYGEYYSGMSPAQVNSYFIQNASYVSSDSKAINIWKEYDGVSYTVSNSIGGYRIYRGSDYYRIIGVDTLDLSSGKNIVAADGVSEINYHLNCFTGSGNIYYCSEEPSVSTAMVYAYDDGTVGLYEASSLYYTRDIGSVNATGTNTSFYGFDETTSVESLRNIVDVAVSKQLSLYSSTGYFVSSSGEMYSVGSDEGESHMLGNVTYGYIGDTLTPVRVDSDAHFTKVSAGKNHVLALDIDGKVYSWGSNGYGQLGQNDNTNRAVPTLVRTLDESKSLSFVTFQNETFSGSFNQYGSTEFSVIENGSKGNLTIDPTTGAFEYVPNSGSYGEDNALIEVGYSSVTVRYPVKIRIDRKPVFIGGNPSFNVECGQAYNGTAHAMDADGDNLVYSIVTEPSKGNVVLYDNAGSFTYTASNEMAGGDTFVIAVSDGYCTVQYPVSVHVQSMITYTDNTTINIDLLSTNIYNGNVHAVDIDGDSLAYSVKKNGSKGSVTIDSEGNYTYTSNGDCYGTDSFTIKIDDGYKPLELIYTVNLYAVSDAGTALAAKITKGTTYTGKIKTNANGADPEYSVHTQPSNGNVVINPVTGEYTYAPNQGSVGDDSFVVLVNYGFGQYTLTIHVYQNTIPNNALVATRITTAENTNYTGTVQCTDADGDTLSYQVKTQPQLGSLSLNPTTGQYIYYPNSNVAGDDSFEATVNDGTDIITNTVNVHIESLISVNEAINKVVSQNTSLSANVNATDKDGDTLTYSISENPNHGIANIDSLTGDYVYIPQTNYYGSDSFKITVDDGVAPKTSTITVNVNRRPIASAISISLETQGLTVTGTAACSDPDGDVLVYSLDSQPSQGSVIVNSTNGGFAYTPHADAKGNDTFQIKATDGCNDILINVTVHNETAVTLGQQDTTIVVNQGRSTTGQVLAVDLDGDELTYSILNYPTQGIVNLNTSTGAWTYNATATATGRDNFIVKVTDGKTEVTLEYTLIINTPASFGESSYSFSTNQNTNYNGSVTATDSNGDLLTYSIVTQGSKGNATIDPSTGRYQYIPTNGAVGNDSFVVGVSDGNFTTEVVINVHIETEITIPNATLTLSLEENGIATGNVNATDPDGDALTYTIFKQGQKGNATVMGDGSFSYFANSGAGDDYFTIAVTDGNQTKYVNVYVFISTEPYFEESDMNITVSRTGSYTGQVHGVDRDGDTLTYSVAHYPSSGSINLNTVTGEYTYNSYGNAQTSSDNFTIAVTDGTTTSYVEIRVIINDGPSVSDSELEISQGKNGTGRIVASDHEGDALTYSIVQQGSYGNASINSSTGEYSYTSTDSSFSGVDHFTVAVSDGYSTVTSVVFVNVKKNQKPTSSGTTIAVSSNSKAVGTLDVNDIENDELTYSISSQGDKGTAFIDEKTGEFTYSAAPDTSGYDCFVVTVSDGYNTVSFLVEVNIVFVDSNISWAIPTTIATGSSTLLALGGLAAVLVFFKRKQVK